MPPIRTIPRNHTSVTGLLPKASGQGQVAFESTLERDLQILMQFDDRVESIEEQPLRISYKGPDGSPRRYTPDLRVRYRRDGGAHGTRPATVAISSLILLVVGTLSGLVPALKASRLDPVEALRYE